MSESAAARGGPMSPLSARGAAAYAACGLAAWGLCEGAARRHVPCAFTVSAMALVLLAMQAASRQCFYISLGIPTKGLVLCAAALCLHLLLSLGVHGYLPTDAKGAVAFHASDICLLLICALWLLSSAWSEGSAAGKAEEAGDAEEFPLLKDLAACEMWEADLEAGDPEGEITPCALDSHFYIEGRRRRDVAQLPLCVRVVGEEDSAPGASAEVAGGVGPAAASAVAQEINESACLPSPEDGNLGALRPLTAQETLIIFDWDDTVLPSTWVQAQGLKLDDWSKPTTWQRAQLDRLAELAAETLRVARTFGTVVFVTNADEGWIEASCEKFLPTLCQSIEDLRLVSARSEHETPERTSPLEWKVRAFEAEIKRFFGAEAAACPDSRKNVMSLGDSNHEREGLLRASKVFPGSRSKSIKFVERPNVDQLCEEQTIVAQGLHRLVYADGNLDLSIRCDTLQG